MRIFEQGYKTNFVDENDVFIGFDTNQNCCEDFGYLFSIEKPKVSFEIGEGEQSSPSDEVLAQMIFDPTFFEEDETGDISAIAIFRLVHRNVARPRSDRSMREAQRDLVAKSLPHELYLTLYNVHNGYYSHGFEVKHGGEIVHSGCL